METVADTAAGTVRAVVDIDGPPERVFRALTDPDELEAWWGAGDAYRTFDWRIDLRPGGEWSCQARNPAGEVSSVRGRYIMLDAPRLLELTWCPSWDDFMETRIRYELAPTPDGTRLTVTHSGFGDRIDSCKEHATGWPMVLGWLSAHVGGAR